MADSLAGMFYPPEWAPHRATWLSWPHNQNTWPGGIASIFDGYIQFINEISKHEQVCINVTDLEMEQHARQMLDQRNVGLGNVSFYQLPTNDAWCRDHGPCFMKHPDGGKLILDWDYNAWGEKYPPFDLDNAIPHSLSKTLHLERIKPGMVLEGGAVECNGAGTLLTTRSCLLNPNRNPDLSQRDIEQFLKKYFRVNQVLWLEHGIAGDDTDGHIDTICRFVNPKTVVTVVEDDPEDCNYEPLQENLKSLKAMKLPDGRNLEIIKLPMPGPKFYQSERLPASYANFYICNEAVLVPTYRDPQDQVALSTLTTVFRDRAVVGIDCLEIIRGLGGLHCLCMQEPL